MDPTPPAESIITPAIRADGARLFGERAAGAMTGKDEEDLSVWLNQDSRHAQAYAEMERIWTAIDGSTMPPAPAANGPAPLPRIRPSTTGGIRAVKQKPDATHHRRGRKSLGRTALAACLLIAVFAQSGTILTNLRADTVTGVGEQRNVTLPDGSQAFLNTDSAIAIDYDAGRQVRLLRGEAAFTVAPAAGEPFVVAVGDGTVTALGTRFIVRMASEETSVAVTEHSVRVHNTETPGTTAACVATMGLDWINPFKALLPLERELPKLRRAPDQVGPHCWHLEKSGNSDFLYHPHDGMNSRSVARAGRVASPGHLCNKCERIVEMFESAGIALRR